MGPISVSTVDVSVVIPCYNAADTLSRALGSVASQSRHPVEVIVVNDGSLDNVREVVDEAQRMNPPYRIQLVERQTNSGAAAARNLGWELATARFIAFLDADDEWFPEKIERQYDIMVQNPHVVLSGHLYTHLVCPKPHSVRISRHVTVSLQQLLFRCVFSTPSAMIRRDVTTRFRTEWTHSEDYLLWMETVARHGPALLIKEPLVRLHKAAYGEAGLSADTCEMQRGQVRAYRLLRSTSTISIPQYLVALAWSYIKYGRRRAILAMRAR